MGFGCDPTLQRMVRNEWSRIESVSNPHLIRDSVWRFNFQMGEVWVAERYSRLISWLRIFYLESKVLPDGIYGA